MTVASSGVTNQLAHFSHSLFSSMDELSNIDRPYKRPRLHYESSDVELNHRRARHDLHLKSRFEEIFQKYEKDFSETADEIDLETGEIVVNNGHLAAMVDEFDLGQDPISASHQQPDVWNTAHDLGSQGTDWINGEEEDIAAFSLFDSTTQAITNSVHLRSETAADFTKPFQHYSSDGLTPRHGEQESQPGRTDRRGHGQLQYSSPANGYHVQSNKADNNTEGLYQAARLDRLALESAWQAPPLPEDRSMSFVHPELPSTSADEFEGGRSPSPPVGSLWAPMAGRGRPRRDGPATQRRRPPPRREPLVHLQRPIFGLDSNQHENNMSYVPSRFRPTLWSQEENELLIKLKATTQLTYREMEPYFTGRRWKSIAFHWSKALRCGERHPYLNGGNDVEPTASTESEEGIMLHDHSPSDKMRNYESSSIARGIPGHSKLPSKLPINTQSRTLMSSNSKPVSSEKRLDATLDFDDELGDYPLAKKLSTIHLTKSSPVPTCSRTNSVLSATGTLKPREDATPRTTNPQARKHQSFNKTPSHTTSPVPTCSHTNPVVSTTKTMKPGETATPRATSPQVKNHKPLNNTPAHKTPLEDNGELSDSCELGLSPPHERASAPSYRTRTGLSAATPLPFKKYKQPGPLGKATTTPKPVVTEDTSEDELATPVKTIGTPQASAKKLCGSSRRSTSNW